jgi:hypothetical protein
VKSRFLLNDASDGRVWTSIKGYRLKGPRKNRRHYLVPTEDRYTLDHPLPLFLSGPADHSDHADFSDDAEFSDHADFSDDADLSDPADLSGHAYEHEEGGSVLLLNGSIVVLVASLVGMAVLLSFGNPTKVFADIEASLTGISAVQADTVQSTPTTLSTTDAKVLPPTESGAPAREENAAHQDEPEIKAAAAGALLKQFQGWADKQNARAQVEPARPTQDARAQAVRNAQARVLRTQKH